jgi:hypothetical protein
MGLQLHGKNEGAEDIECFRSFGRRASDLLTPLVPDSILRRWWPLAVERMSESHRIGLAIAQARHQLEERYGLETIEIPVSELMRLPTVMGLHVVASCEKSRAPRCI